MNYLVFTLSMPSRGSWNNKWSGENNKYAKARRFCKKDFDRLPNIINKVHTYRWDDGWMAAVNVEHVTSAKEKDKLIKGSIGFCGYDWMIDSLIKYGKIVDKYDKPEIKLGVINVIVPFKNLDHSVDFYANKFSQYNFINIDLYRDDLWFSIFPPSEIFYKDKELFLSTLYQQLQQSKLAYLKHERLKEFMYADNDVFDDVIKVVETVRNSMEGEQNV